MLIQRALVVGSGSAGRRHARLLKKIRPELDVFLLPSRGTTGVFSSEDSLANLTLIESYAEARMVDAQAILICNPSNHRIEAVNGLLEDRAHFFLEKPLASNLSQGLSLMRLFGKCPDRVMIGYNMRYRKSLLDFHEEAQELVKRSQSLSVLVECGQDLKNWRPGFDYRTGVSAKADLGGGVLNELSHEVDYLLWLFGMPDFISATLKKLRYEELDVEDTANLIMEFSSPDQMRRVTAAVNLDFTRDAQERFCEIHSDIESLKWDGVSSQILHKVPGKPWRVLRDYQESIDASYENELREFLSRAEAGKVQTPNLLDGLKVLRVLSAARLSNESRLPEAPLES